mmetsp:Transcript_6499/g.9189  ORF Transcript_6499/g.9189 Transcript_6499/m.9189 type:complete len:187 (+) Transcript_6499:344-904(+)
MIRLRMNFLLLFVAISQLIGTSESFVVNNNNRAVSFATKSAVKRTTQLSMVAKTGGKYITTTEEYSESVLDPDAPRPVMVFFSAPWCGPCRLSVPVVKDIMKQFSGRIDAVEVCTDDLPDVACDSGVVSIPTIQMYYKGELLDTIVGCVARNVLASAVDKVLEDVVEDEKHSTAANANGDGKKEES